jgi:hypothetical protein
MRTLRRPMFRIGGKAEVGNDGIMSGLVDREELQDGTAKEKFESVAKRPSLFGFRFNEPFLSIPTPENRIGAVKGFEFMSPKIQSEGLTKIGEAISDKTPRMDELGLEELAKPVRYSPSQERAMAASDLQVGEGDLNLSPKDIKGLQEFYKTLNVKGNLDYKGGIPEVKTEVPDASTSKIEKEDTGSNVVTQAEKNAILKARAEEFEELLNPGARKRVINNALAAASGAFSKSTGNTMQDIANAITAAAGATSEIDKTKQKAAELAIGESIQKGIAREKKPAVRPNATESLINFYRESGLSNEEIANKISKTSESELDYIRAYPVASQGKAAYVSNVEMKGNELFGGVLSNDKEQRKEELKTLNPDKLYYDSSQDAYVKIVTGEDGKPTVQIVSKR